MIKLEPLFDSQHFYSQNWLQMKLFESRESLQGKKFIPSLFKKFFNPLSEIFPEFLKAKEIFHKVRKL